MLIKNVLDFKIVDSERVGCFAMNNIKYHKDAGKIMIKTGILLKFHVDIEEFDILLLG